MSRHCDCRLRHRKARRLRFRCTACKTWHCGYHEGTDDMIGLCDDCWVRHDRRRARREVKS